MPLQKPQGLGSPTPPRETRRLVMGEGVFLDDLQERGMLAAAFLRSPYPHARVLSIDTSAALALDGVHAVLTGDEVRTRSVAPQPVIWRSIPDQLFPETYAMAVDKVLYVGQPVAAVAASDRFVAEDALELIEVVYEELPHVVTLDDALADQAVRLYPDWPSNVSGEASFAVGDAEAALASSHVVVEETFECGRQNGVPLETRGCLARWQRATGELDAWVSTQSPHQIREYLAQVLGLEHNQVRVRAPDLGGGFGNKHDFYGEEVVVSMLSHETGRPVKWVEDRRESFVANAHSSEVRVTARLGADEAGRLTAMTATVTGALGGTLGYVGMGPVWMTGRRILGPYRIPNADITVRGVVMNKSPFGSYRGWGQAQANFVHERLMDKLASRLGIAPDDLRSRNFPEPEEFPYQSAFNRFDSGRYAECLQLLVDTVAERGWRDRVSRCRAQGRSLGIGIASYVEGTGLGASRLLSSMGLQQSGVDSSRIEIDAGGTVTVYSGHTSMGQGIGTALALVAADALGVSDDDVRVVLGDTGSGTYTGYGTAASRAATAGGAVVRIAAERLRDRVLEVAADMLEADPVDLRLVDGAISVVGEAKPRLTLADVAEATHRDVTKGSATAQASTLVEEAHFDPAAAAIAYGSVAALVEVDRETGHTSLLDYVSAHDCGTVINPLVVDGQVVGGTAQAMGATLWEELLYDQDGQIVTTSFMDYLLPSAEEVPPITVLHMVTPSPHIPGGMKGVGEGGMIGASSAIAGAIDDALSDLDVRVRQLPITPERLHHHIAQAKAAS